MSQAYAAMRQVVASVVVDPNGCCTVCARFVRRVPEERAPISPS